MNCPTCGHALQCILNRPGDESTAYHCLRCGTAVVDYGADWREITTPMLVQRCRMFADELGDQWYWRNHWTRLGIAEAIAPPTAPNPATTATEGQPT